MNVLRCDSCFIVQEGYGWLALQRDATSEDSDTWHFCSFACLKTWATLQLERLAG